MMSTSPVARREQDPVTDAFNTALTEHRSLVRFSGFTAYEGMKRVVTDRIFQKLPDGMHKADAGTILDGVSLLATSQAHTTEFNRALLELSFAPEADLTSLRQAGFGEMIPESHASALLHLARVVTHAESLAGPTGLPIIMPEIADSFPLHLN